MVIVRRNIGIFLRHVVKGTLPEIEGEGEHVRFAAQGKLFLPVPLPGVLEGVTDAAFHALSRIDRFLDRYLVGRAFLEHAARAGIEPFRVLTHDDEVDILRLFILQRRFNAGEQLHRTEVDIQVEVEPQPKENAFLKDPRFHVGMTDGTEKDGVERPQVSGGMIGERLSGPFIPFSTEIEFGKFELESAARCGGVQYFYPFTNYFRAGAVTG